MALSIYFSVVGGSEISGALTDAENQEELQEQLASSGSDEKILGFISSDGDAAEALAAISAVNIEQEGSIGHKLEELLARAFSLGVNYGLRANYRK